ncbi:strawberry notch C-terminal domain-containing protein [Phenylobacterium sp. J367]|nr:strawberry notch C-terminal domain-containing protein [Phenylobacterium sp. J367]
MDAIEDEEGAVTMVPVMVDGVPVVSQEALRLRDELVTHLACLPAVPGVLDAVLDAIGTEIVAEITGRSRRVVRRDGRRVVERRSASAAKAETDAFMAGKKRVLVFSDAGGTGRSYHADLGAANQQRRVHYLVEPGWRADAAIQGLGRSHRTNQAVAPLFRPVTTDIHGEKRFTSTIARRLDSLGALTRGERRTAGNGLFRAEDNLESPWAHRALQAFYIGLHFGNVEAMDRETFEAKTGLRLLDHEGNLKKSDDMPPMNTFLNRLLALRIADQNSLFAAFDAILGSILERAQASGALDRGMEDIVADDVVISDEEVIRTDAVTGAETRLTRFQVRTVRQLTSAEDALTGLDRDGVIFAVNSKSGRAAIVVQGLTTTNDDDRLIPRRAPDPPGEALDRLAEGVRRVGVGGRRRSGLARGVGRRDRPSRPMGLARPGACVGAAATDLVEPAGQGDLGPPAEGAGRPALAGPCARPGSGPAAEGGLGTDRHRQRLRRRRRDRPARSRGGRRSLPGGRPVAAARQGNGSLPDRGGRGRHSALGVHGARLLRRDHRLHTEGVRAGRPTRGPDRGPGEVAGADNVAGCGVGPASNGSEAEKPRPVRWAGLSRETGSTRARPSCQAHGKGGGRGEPGEPAWEWVPGRRWTWPCCTPFLRPSAPPRPGDRSNT